MNENVGGTETEGAGELDKIWYKQVRELQEEYILPKSFSLLDKGSLHLLVARAYYWHWCSRSTPGKAYGTI